jgi:hypothetical protein
VTAAPTHHPQPHESLERCALRAQLRGDHMLGTAFPAGRVLMVEQPGPWGRAGLTQSHFDPVIAAELVERGKAAGIRVMAIRRPGRTPSGAQRRWALADCRPGFESIRGGVFAADAELADLPLDDQPLGDRAGEPIEGPWFLICAHSKHDTCCALRGRPVAAAMHAERPGQVWECSHLGGERYSANVLVLPLGLLYGRVLPFAAPEFVAAAEAGEVIGALLRGRVGVAPVAQAALAFGYEQLGLRRVDALRVLSVGEVQDAHADVRLVGPHGELVVRVQVQQIEAFGLSCAKPFPATYPEYRPVRITAAQQG